jgi:hypothetical protein
MVQGSRRPVVALLVAGVVGVAVVPASAAGAATITACVKSSTGDVRIHVGAAAKKRCQKGWKRVRWGSAGPTGKQGVPGTPGTPGAPGSQGPAGPAWAVKDATGATVGQFMGLIPEGVPFYAVLRDGGFYYYLGSGQVYPLGSPDWTMNDCTGTAYLKGFASFSATSLGLLVGGPFRTIFRTVSATGTFGPTSAWKGHGTTEAVSTTQLYRRNGTTGACEADGGVFTGSIAPLDPVTAPPDFAGPLTIG